MVKPKISLEQWTAFRAVVDEGSYALAAESLNKSQSSISYMLNKMEQRLPAPVLRLVGRRAELTELGEVLYRQACSLLDQAAAIDSVANYHASGWQTEIVIAADAITPMTKLFCALQRFSELSPHTRVRILETTLSGTDEALLERRADIAITPTVPVGFLAEPLWPVDMLAVVSKNHALATYPQLVTELELKQYRQIVIRDSGIKRSREAGWLASEQRWTVSHFSSSVEAVKAGLGFAFVPVERVRALLATGELVEPKLAISGRRSLMLNLIIAEQSQAGPAVAALAAELQRG